MVESVPDEPFILHPGSSCWLHVHEVITLPDDIAGGWREVVAGPARTVDAPDGRDSSTPASPGT